MSAATPVTHLWLREETKPMEHRAALSPDVCKTLLESGDFAITVEESKERIFADSEYAAAGCMMAPGDSWRTAPSDAIITGLKELPENDQTALPHTHIMFAHCYKQQGGWKDVLSRFDAGKGLLYDLEFLQDDAGRRVAAFGFYAGFTGAAVGIDAWCHQQLSGGKYPTIKPYPNEDVLIAETKAKLASIGRLPKIMVMGALGRCGSGAVSYARKAGIPEENIVKWDMAETAKGGPFQEIMDVDIFVNCIYLSSQIPPFITQQQIDSDRQLSVIVDVSCDTTNPFNPIPIYNVNTTFDNALLDIPTANAAKPLQLCSIDHLPTMLPRESSNQFALDLLPTLQQLPNRSAAPVWTRAEKLFHDKVQSIATAD
ncbi:Saccharopine dehydrogenase [Coemansia sp. RSA 2322]|nr:Saccharopine dehydrogenase [Coemansia sp. RSA 2322]